MPLSEVADKKIDKVLNDINNSLYDLNKNQDTIADILRDQQKQDIKDKTRETSMNEDEKNTKQLVDSSKNQNKKMSALRKTFQESFSSIKDFVSPGGIMKSFGLMSGSPIFMLMGDKLDNLISQYKEAKKEDFMAEQNREEEIRLAEKQNELLEDIKNKEFTIDKDKKGLIDIIKAPLALLTNLLPKRLLKVLSTGFIGKMLKGVIPTTRGAGGGLLRGVKGKATRGAGGLLKGAGKLAKGGAKLLGKAALPLALLTGGFDFIEGFKKSLEITGKEDITSKIQAGISEVISGFTFGLVDSKTIYKGIEFLTNKLKDLFFAPLVLVKDIFTGEKPIMESVSEYLSKFTFGLISKESISKGLTFLKDKIKGIFLAPFVLIKDIFTGEKPIMESVSEYLSKFTFGFVSKESISKGLTFLKDKIKGIFLAPFKFMKNLIMGEEGEKTIIGDIFEKISEFTFNIISKESISKGLTFLKDKIKGIFLAPFNFIKNLIMGEEGEKSIIGSVMEKISSFSFDIISKENITKGISFLKEKITGLFSNVFGKIKSAISESPLFDSIKDIDFEGAKEKITDFKDSLKEKVESTTNFFKDSFGSIKGFFSSVKDKIGFDMKDDTGMKKIIPSPMHTKDDMEKITPVKKGNVVLEKIQVEKIRVENIKAERAGLMGEQQKLDKSINNNIVQTNQNNIVVQEDLNTRTDDFHWVKSLQF